MLRARSLIAALVVLAVCAPAAAAASALIPAAVVPLARLGVRAPASITWAAARRRGIPVRVRAAPGARVRAVVVAAGRRLGSRTRRLGPSGTRLIRVRVRGGRSDRRRARLEVSAVTPAGRRIASARRIVLLPRR